MDLLDKIKQDLETIFKTDPKRLKHIYGVNKMAIYLGEKLGVDTYKCSLAALLHDIHKNLSYEEQKEYLSVEELEEIETNVQLHAYSASVIAKKVYKIDDKDVIMSIRSHVYGNMDMSLLDKIILVSDFCEENRVYEYCVKTRKVLLSGNFDLAVKMTLNLTIQSLLDRDITPTKQQLEINRKYGN